MPSWIQGGIHNLHAPGQITLQRLRHLLGSLGLHFWLLPLFIIHGLSLSAQGLHNFQAPHVDVGMASTTKLVVNLWTEKEISARACGMANIDCGVP